MAYTLVCPVYAADNKVVGHGTAAGYSPGGAWSHATRCSTMGDILRGQGIEVETAPARRGVESESDFFAAIAAKNAARSAPEQASAAEPVATVTIDGKLYREV